MSNEHVREPFRTILESIVRPVPKPEPKPATKRDRYRILEAIYEEMIADGCVLNIEQLDRAIREYEDRLRDLDGQRQYSYEQSRRRGVQ